MAPTSRTFKEALDSTLGEDPSRPPSLHEAIVTVIRALQRLDNPEFSEQSSKELVNQWRILQLKLANDAIDNLTEVRTLEALISAELGATDDYLYRAQYWQDLLNKDPDNQRIFQRRSTLGYAAKRVTDSLTVLFEPVLTLMENPGYKKSKDRLVKIVGEELAAIIDQLNQPTTERANLTREDYQRFFSALFEYIYTAAGKEHSFADGLEGSLLVLEENAPFIEVINGTIAQQPGKKPYDKITVGPLPEKTNRLLPVQEFVPPGTIIGKLVAWLTIIKKRNIWAQDREIIFQTFETAYSEYLQRISERNTEQRQNKD